MFAYCGNNPIDRKDSTGTMSVTARQEQVDPFSFLFSDMGFGGGGCAPSYAAALAIGIAVVNTASTITITQTTSSKEKEGITVITDSRARNNQESAIYYGADMRGGVWKKVTPGMTYEQAIAWVISTSVAGTYGKKASWGLYTTDRTDAESIVMALGGPGICLHENRSGEYPHYHPMGMILFGQYKHFHVWYGNIYGG